MRVAAEFAQHLQGPVAVGRLAEDQHLLRQIPVRPATFRLSRPSRQEHQRVGGNQDLAGLESAVEGLALVSGQQLRNLPPRGVGGVCFLLVLARLDRKRDVEACEQVPAPG